MIISERRDKCDSDFQDFLMVIISAKNWLEGTLRKAPFKWLYAIYVQKDKNTMRYEVRCSLNTKEAAEKAHGFLLSWALPVSLSFN